MTQKNGLFWNADDEPEKRRKPKAWEKQGESVEHARMDAGAPEATTTAERLKAAWERYHAENPDVYKVFCEMAQKALASGRKRFSARTICEAIRWDRQVGSTSTQRDAGFKIANAHSRFYADLWTEENPEHSEFFRSGDRPSERRRVRGARA